MKMEKGSGSPVRPFAIVPKELIKHGCVGAGSAGIISVPALLMAAENGQYVKEAITSALSR